MGRPPRAPTALQPVPAVTRPSGKGYKGCEEAHPPLLQTRPERNPPTTPDAPKCRDRCKKDVTRVAQFSYRAGRLACGAGIAGAQPSAPMDSAEYFKPSNVTLRARRDFRIAEGVGHRYLLHRARLNLAWANVSAFSGAAPRERNGSAAKLSTCLSLAGRTVVDLRHRLR